MNLFAQAACADTDNAALELQFPERHVRVGSDVIGVRECGRGPQTVLLLHGISSGAASWAQCASILGRQVRVIAWDAPGYGASSPLSAAVPSALHYAQRLAALLDELNIDRCLLVGHSLGALMAAAYGTLAGQRAWRSVLLSPALGYGSAEKKHLADQMRAKRFEALERDGLEAIAHKLPDRLLTRAASSAQQAIVTRNALRLNTGGYRQAVEMLCSENIEQYTPNLSPTQVYCGEHDVVTSPAQSQAFAKRSGLPFGLIKEAGHACYVEQPDQVAGLLGNLASSQDRRIAG